MCYNKLLIKCPHCLQKNIISLRDEGGSYSCPVCRRVLIEDHVVIKGYIYLVSNDTIPGLLKIGYSERPVEQRVKELSSHTSVAKPFFIEAYYESYDPNDEEKFVHEALSEYRLEGREFFRIDTVNALDTISRVLNRKPAYVSDFLKLRYDKPCAGQIYVITNGVKPGLVRIEYSEKTAEEIIEELGYHSWLPFFVAATFNSYNPDGDVKKIHEALTEYEETKDGFFIIDAREAVNIAVNILNSSPAYLCEQLEKENN